MPDMNPENNRDTFRGRGFRIQELESENAEMKAVFKLILENDCLPHWAYEKDIVNKQSLYEMIKNFIADKDNNAICQLLYSTTSRIC